MNVLFKSKGLVKRVLVNTKVLSFANQFKARCIAILKYHSVQDKPEQFDDSIGNSIIHTTFVFKEQMELVAKYFNPVTMDDILLFLKGEKRIPKKSVAVTFDDGYADNFEIAAPILDHYGIQATFYITVGTIEIKPSLWFLRLRHAIWTTKKKEWLAPDGRLLKIQNRNDRVAAMRIASMQCSNLVGAEREKTVSTIEQVLDVKPFAPNNGLMMNWDQIKKLHQSGHIIGSHTLTHPNVAHLEDKDLHRELAESKHILEKELGASVVHFSYPNPAIYPHFTEQTTTAVKQSGYQTAVISTPGGTVHADSDPLSLKRVWVPNQKDEFLWHLEWSMLFRRM